MQLLQMGSVHLRACKYKPCESGMLRNFSAKLHGGMLVVSLQIWQQAVRRWGRDVHIRRGELCGMEWCSAGY